ncbi:MAG: hypothetical protein RRY10_07200, partial [Christensenellaceae bacterium]
TPLIDGEIMGVEEKTPELVDAVNTQIDTVKSTTLSYLGTSDFESIGRTMMSKIASGITAMESVVVSAAQGVAAQVKSALSFSVEVENTGKGGRVKAYDV